MRSIWLATTAILITAGIACAQSTTPAPTGSVTAPTVSPSSTASPGKMGANTGSSSMTSSGATSGSMGSASNAMTAPGGTTTPSPAPNGAINAPVETSQSPGKTAPAQGLASGASSGTSASATAMPASASSMPAMPSKPMHHWSSGSTLPENASATTYLHIAKSAINHHNVTLADDALSHAETRLLDRVVPQGQIMADDSPSIQSIESARKALRAGDFSQASMDTKQAYSAVSGM